MMIGEWMVAVTYLEWLRWVAVGRLRLNDRVVWVRSNDDQMGFDELMNRAPDLDMEDDHGYILAALGDDLHGSIMPLQSGSGLGLVHVPVSVVSGFFPLTERAARLLEADASRASVKLNPPQFGSVWAVWLSSRRDELRSNRSSLLCQALGFKELPTNDALPEAIGNVLRGDAQSPAAERASRLKGSSAYAWALAFGFFGEAVGDEVKKEFASRLKLNELLIDIERNYPTSKPQMDSAAVAVSLEMESYLSSVGYEYFPLRLIAVVLHYQHLLGTGREADLQSLLIDLTKLGTDISVRESALAASFIAVEMDDAAVTSLFYQSQPERFPALQPRPVGYELDVEARIRQYTKPQETDVQEHIDPSGSSPGGLSKALESNSNEVVSPEVAGGAVEHNKSTGQSTRPLRAESPTAEAGDGVGAVIATDTTEVSTDNTDATKKSLDPTSPAEDATSGAPTTKSAGGSAQEPCPDGHAGATKPDHEDLKQSADGDSSSLNSASSLGDAKDGVSKSKRSRSSKKPVKAKGANAGARQKDLGI